MTRALSIVLLLLALAWSSPLHLRPPSLRSRLLYTEAGGLLRELNDIEKRKSSVDVVVVDDSGGGAGVHDEASSPPPPSPQEAPVRAAPDVRSDASSLTPGAISPPLLPLPSLPLPSPLPHYPSHASFASPSPSTLFSYLVRPLKSQLYSTALLRLLNTSLQSLPALVLRSMLKSLESSTPTLPLLNR